MLEKEGWLIPPEHGFASAEGHDRIYRHLDDTTVCWETFAKREGEGDHMLRHVVSYDTMSECIKGFVLTSEETLLWVFAKSKETS